MSIWHLVLLLVVVVVIFGTGKLRNMGGDIGGALRDFKKGLSGDEEEEAARRAAEARRRDEDRLRADPPPRSDPPPVGDTQRPRDSSDIK